MTGRTLHLVDIENLAATSRLDRPTAEHTVVAYRRRIAVREGDHVVVAADVHNALPAGLAWGPGVRLRAGFGPDGADTELLDAAADVDWVAAHYSRVVIGSGDHAFAALASALRARGVAVVVVARPGGTSRWLRRAACLVLPLDVAVPVTPAA
ncbi:MAG TPA: NYN domain-containing protein [Acidimicrobiales bacterium]|nr:NYN domain-containing protein [Acidimicrobiales bacterium]